MIKSLHAVAALGLLASVTISASQRTAQPPAAGKSPITTVATVREVMEAITIPASNAVFEAASEPPKEADRWKDLRTHGVLLAESGNLLMLPGRARDNGEWIKFATLLRDAAVDVMKAADAKDHEKFSAASDKMYESCENCHAKYLTQ